MLPIVHNVVHLEGHSPRRPGEYFECTHATHIVACHVRASGNYIVGTENLDLRAPYMGLLAAGERDANGLMGPFEMYWCAFDWDGIVREAGQTVAVAHGESSVRRSHIRPLSAPELRTAVGLFRELHSLARRPDFASRLSASARVLSLLALWSQPPAARGSHERAVRLYQSLIEQYAERPDITLAAMAERAGFSADHLGVLFHRDLGMTPVEYRTRLRLLRARELLVSTAQPVREVARESGFPDANYFARVFRRAYGQSPRTFARTHSLGLPGGRVVRRA